MHTYYYDWPSCIDPRWYYYLSESASETLRGAHECVWTPSHNKIKATTVLLKFHCDLQLECPHPICNAARARKNDPIYGCPNHGRGQSYAKSFLARGRIRTRVTRSAALFCFHSRSPPGECERMHSLSLGSVSTYRTSCGFSVSVSVSSTLVARHESRAARSSYPNCGAGFRAWAGLVNECSAPPPNTNADQFAPNSRS